MDALDPEPLRRFLHESGVQHILVGGTAVAAHGYRRPSKDLDIVPAADPETWRGSAKLSSACTPGPRTWATSPPMS